jgi:hypothetical protein
LPLIGEHQILSPACQTTGSHGGRVGDAIASRGKPRNNAQSQANRQAESQIKSYSKAKSGNAKSNTESAAKNIYRGCTGTELAFIKGEK